jgi:pimeloyl-ACP methyl ester carboxylesterase
MLTRPEPPFSSHIIREVLAGCGHYVAEERPEEVAGLLLSSFDGA